MERMKSLEQLASQYVRMAIKALDESKQRRDKVEHAFVKTVREMRAALGVPESERLSLSSPLYTQQIEVGSYYGRTI